MVEASSFEWRAALGSWRWLMLGAIGAGTACGGQVDSGTSNSDAPAGQGGGGSTSGVNPTAMGGSPPVRTPQDRGGAAGLGGEAGVSGTGNSPPEPKPSVCEGEVSLEGGMVRCSNGVLHRPSSSSCAVALPLPELIPEGGLSDAGRYACLHNADCTEKPLGQCMQDFADPYCRYGCANDGDCEANQICLCEGTVGRCEQMLCRLDSECGTGRLCASHSECGYARFVCTTGVDQCLTDADCPNGSPCVLGEISEINPLVSPAGQYRKCGAPVPCPVPGRPFLVAGEPRLAPIAARCDWYSHAEGERAPSQPAAELCAELCAELARGWTEQALMEHASIAAFARFTLQLLSLGAPAELVARSTEAMGDELRHAQDCFRLARRYSKSELGPGPLAMAGALEHTGLSDVVLGTLREGCLGETVAAIEAAEAVAHCEDAQARAVLERIALEESRHAELAWRFVAWALETAAAPERTKLLSCIRAALAEELAAPSVPGEIAELDRELARHGLLSVALRQALRVRVLREVVAPCVEALLASTPGARAHVLRSAHGVRFWEDLVP